MVGCADNNPAHCAHVGTYGYVCFAEVTPGEYPGEEFWKGLTVPEQAKFMALFRKITEDRHLRLWNREKFKQLEGELFEFKQNSIKMRWFTFRYRNQWHLLDGFKGKKENNLPETVVLAAIQQMNSAKALLHRNER